MCCICMRKKADLQQARRESRAAKEKLSSSIPRPLAQRAGSCPPAAVGIERAVGRGQSSEAKMWRTPPAWSGRLVGRARHRREPPSPLGMTGIHREGPLPPAPPLLHLAPAVSPPRPLSDVAPLPWSSSLPSSAESRPNPVTAHGG
jgi:hypothetical protein